MSTQLIPVVASVIGNQTVQTVDGRALHTFLEVQTEFKNWIVRRIEEYSFEEDKDFRSFLTESTGGRPTKEYALALDMAKELAMVERTPKGKEARQYFIECERRLYAESQPQPADPATLAQQLADLLNGKVAVDRSEWTTVRQGIDALREAFGWLDQRAETIERTAICFPAAPHESHANQQPAVHDFQNARQKVLAFIAARKKQGAGARHMHQFCKSYRNLPDDKRKELIRQLLSAGEIVEVFPESQPGARRKAVIYVAKAFAGAEQ